MLHSVRSKLWIALFGVLAMTRLTLAADPADIRAELNNAKKAYADAVAAARADLLTALDTAIKGTAQAGDLDGVLALKAEQKAFEENEKLPVSQKVKSATAEYQKATKSAVVPLDKAYDQAIKESTRSLQIEQAESLRAEWKAVQARRSGEIMPKPESRFEYKFYDWKKGDAPIKLIHKDEGFCYLAGINGALNGGGETVQLTIERDGYWWFKASSVSEQSLNVRIVSVRLLPSK